MDDPVSLCPLTLEPIPSSDPEVGVIYATATPFPEGGPCGHRCTLLPLVRHIQGYDGSTAGATVLGGGDKSKEHGNQPSSGGMPSCPVCHDSAVTSICDGAVAKSSLGGQLDIVCFRYAKQNYWLSVPMIDNSEWTWPWRKRRVSAQERIAQVLGMNVIGGLKILHKGKVVFPDPQCTPEDTSLWLIELSNAAFSKNKGKPSLVVMGTRAGMELRNDPRSSSSPYGSGWAGIFYWGFDFVFQTVKSILGGILLFGKTVFFLPAPRGDDSRED